MEKHWLYQPSTIKKLWVYSIVILLITVIAEIFITLHPHFSVAGYFAFHAIYGFGSCVLMILFARVLGAGIKRQDDYYDH